MRHVLTKYDALGKAEHGWLHANFHFSFANYYNPTRMGFGKIRVINDDIIEPHNGFGAHPHDNMEIISFVRSGAITHKDSMGNEGRTEAGDVQVMSAGTGVMHSEYNLEDEVTNLYQIWILPDIKNVKPRWESGSFKNTEKNQFKLLVSGFNDERESLKIHQDVNIYSVQFDKSGNSTVFDTDRDIYVLCSSGELVIKTDSSSVTDQLIKMSKGDGLEIDQLKEKKTFEFVAKSDDVEVIVIET